MDMPKVLWHKGVPYLPILTSAQSDMLKLTQEQPGLTASQYAALVDRHADKARKMLNRLDFAGVLRSELKAGVRHYYPAYMVR